MTTAAEPGAVDVAALTEMLADAMMFGLGYHAEQVTGYRPYSDDFAAAAREFIEAYLPARALLARLAEAEQAGTPVTEWAVRWADGETVSCGWMPGVSESFARNALVPDPRRVVQRDTAGAVVVTRQRTTYPDRVTEWTALTGGDR